MLFGENLGAMELSALLELDGSALTSCVVDLTQIEQGYREIHLPDGVESIASEAFSAYNDGACIERISQHLYRHRYYQDRWEKQLRQRKLSKFGFPNELKTIPEKARYLFRAELQQRLLMLKLPASLRCVNPEDLPVFLQRIEVDESNPVFKSVDGILYSKDGKTLIRYPGYRDGELFQVPEGVESIMPGAFYRAAIKRLILPSSLRELPERCFREAMIEEIEIHEGLVTIRKECFYACHVCRLKLPKTLHNIEDHAFQRVRGIQELECESEELSIGVGCFSEGQFDTISWWCWSEIPKATFLNANIKHLDLPDGVVSIRDYAFAGCYRTNHIAIPESVVQIEPRSFDLGPTWSGSVTLPTHLFHYLYRLPPCARYNRRSKAELWPMRTNQGFLEEQGVLQEQKDAAERRLNQYNLFQSGKKRILREMILQIETQLAIYDAEE